jgi:hypothetical protein
MISEQKFNTRLNNQWDNANGYNMVSVLVWIYMDNTWEITTYIWSEQRMKWLKGLVKPKWIRYEESWIGLTILLSVHICFYENQTRAWLILTVTSRRHSSKVHNIELSMDAQNDVTQEWLDRVKIVRKGLRGTKRRWRPSDSLWTEVPWLRWRREYLH